MANQSGPDHHDASDWLQTKWAAREISLISQGKAHSRFTSVFGLQRPSCAMGNTADTCRRLNVYSAEGVFLINNVFVMKLIFLPVPLQFSWSFFETYVSFHLLYTLLLEPLHNARDRHP